jgi:hypothetical protein
MVPHPRKATINRTKGPVTSDNNRPRSLREIELEVLEEGREWTRQRLEQKLQEEADRQGGVFPPQPRQGSTRAKARHDSKKRRGTRQT